MDDIFNDIITFIISPKIEGPLLILKIVFIIFSLAFLAFIIWAYIASNWFQRYFFQDLVEIATYKPYAARRLAKRWEKIIKRLETGIESEYKLAIIEADGMLDDILKTVGYTGETIGDRLAQLTTETLANIEQVKEAHKIRSSIIHDPDYRLTLDKARSILAIYKKAMKDLQPF